MLNGGVFEIQLHRWHFYLMMPIFKEELTVSVCFGELIATSNLHFTCIILQTVNMNMKIGQNIVACGQ